MNLPNTFYRLRLPPSLLAPMTTAATDWGRASNPAFAARSPGRLAPWEADRPYTLQKMSLPLWRVFSNASLRQHVADGLATEWIDFPNTSVQARYEPGNRSIQMRIQCVNGDDQQVYFILSEPWQELDGERCVTRIFSTLYDNPAAQNELFIQLEKARVLRLDVLNALDLPRKEPAGANDHIVEIHTHAVSPTPPTNIGRVLHIAEAAHSLSKIQTICTLTVTGPQSFEFQTRDADGRQSIHHIGTSIETFWQQAQKWFPLSSSPMQPSVFDEHSTWARPGFVRWLLKEPNFQAVGRIAEITPHRTLQGRAGSQNVFTLPRTNAGRASYSFTMTETGGIEVEQVIDGVLLDMDSQVERGLVRDTDGFAEKLACWLCGDFQPALDETPPLRELLGELSRKRTACEYAHWAKASNIDVELTYDSSEDACTVQARANANIAATVAAETSAAKLAQAPFKPLQGREFKLQGDDPSGSLWLTPMGVVIELTDASSNYRADRAMFCTRYTIDNVHLPLLKLAAGAHLEDDNELASLLSAMNGELLTDWLTQASKVPYSWSTEQRGTSTRLEASNRALPVFSDSDYSDLEEDWISPAIFLADVAAPVQMDCLNQGATGFVSMTANGGLQVDWRDSLAEGSHHDTYVTIGQHAGVLAKRFDCPLHELPAKLKERISSVDDLVTELMADPIFGQTVECEFRNS